MIIATKIKKFFILKVTRAQKRFPPLQLGHRRSTRRRGLRLEAHLQRCVSFSNAEQSLLCHHRRGRSVLDARHRHSTHGHSWLVQRPSTRQSEHGRVPLVRAHFMHRGLRERQVVQTNERREMGVEHQFDRVFVHGAVFYHLVRNQLDRLGLRKHPSSALHYGYYSRFGVDHDWVILCLLYFLFKKIKTKN